MKRERQSLTEKRVERFSIESAAPKAIILWDGDLLGFGCKVQPTGTKAFIVSYRFRRRQRQITLGSFPALSVNEARGRAKRILAAVFDNIDPLTLREKERARLTVRELTPLFLAARSHLKSIKKYKSRLEKRALPAIGAAVVASVTTADLTRLHQKISEDKKIEANRVIEVLHSFFEYARECGEIEKTADNPAKAVPRNTETPRDRYLRPEEMPKLAEALNNYREKNYFVTQLVWLYLLTGARKDELREARWEWLDRNAAQLVIPETKNGSTHYQTLSGAAIQLLDKLERVSGNPYIFPTGFGTRPMPISGAQVDRAWQKIRKAAGVTDVRLHDLRRTVASWLAQGNNSLYLVGDVLNHKDPRSTKGYARFVQGTRVKALDDYADRLMNAAGASSSTNPPVGVTNKKAA